MKKIILFSCIVFASRSHAQWNSATNKLYSDPSTSVGIGVTDPIVELDVDGNLNLSKSQLIGKKLSFGTLSDNASIFFTPGTTTYPPTLSFRLPGSGNGPFPNGAEGIPIPEPTMGCAPATDHLNVYVNGLITLGSNGSQGNLMLTHNGTDGYIETQGLGAGGSTHPGDLFINGRCNRNVFVFNEGGPFYGGASNIMSIGGALNVTENAQIGGGSQSAGFSQPGAQLYIDAGVNQLGLAVKHGYGGGGAGIMTTESFDSDWGLQIFKETSPGNPAQRFGVLGDGKTEINTTNSEALTISDANSSSAVFTRIKTNGQTFLGDKLAQNTGAMFTVGQSSKTSLALSLTDNTSTTNKDFFNVYGNGYTEIKVYSSANLPSPSYAGTTPAITNPRVFAIRDVSAQQQDLFVVTAQGKVYAREVEIRLSQNFPDYVFAKDYDLKSIKEVASYIRKNKHLPGFEKGEFYEKNGLIVNDMIIKQQEKLEEQMLYIIQLEKRLEALEKKN